jgi:hemolysin activation/secretion protein
VKKETIPLAVNRSVPVDYVPLSVGWSASRPDLAGSTSFNFNQSLFLSGLASARTNFQVLAGSTAAGGDYTTLTAGMSREQKLGDDWSLLLRANGQWASEPLISNEQFAVGGTSGVRGYREGEAYGDSGWRTLLDLRAPPVNVGYFPNEPEDIPAYLRCSLFMDYGETYHLAPAAGPAIRQWGTGVGFYLTGGEHFDARLTLAWALRQTPLTRAGDAFAYFSVGLQF